MALQSSARNLIVTIGQSLNSAPDASGPNSLYGQILNHYAGRARVERGHIPGVAWLQWKGGGWDSYYNYWATRAERVIFNMCGGSTDYSTTANRTGAVCYADEGTIATNLRALGVAGQVKVIGSTTNPSIDLGANTTTTAVQDVATFTGTGVLNVVSTAIKNCGVYNGLAYPTGNMMVATTTGVAKVHYTGSTATTYTGCNTTSGSGITSVGGACRQSNEQFRLDGNVLVLSDASGYFDRIVDYANIVNLTDPSVNQYYLDGTHPTALGQTLMFAAAQTAIDGLLI